MDASVGSTSWNSQTVGWPGKTRSARSDASGLSTLNEDQIAERGARMARRDDREYPEYLREEQRRQPRGPQRGIRVGVETGCPAREVVLDQRGQATSSSARRRALRPALPSAD